jgi:hypothetical protein
VAEIRYIGVKERKEREANGEKPYEESRIEKLRGDLLELKNAKLKAIYVSRNAIEEELEAGFNAIKRTLEASGLEPRNVTAMLKELKRAREEA